jgi:microcystin degradation protein MlrC
MAAAEAHAAPVELVPIIRASGWTGGTVTTEAMKHIEERLLTGLAKAGAIDGFYFALHGAMVAEGVDDVSGHLLAAVREKIGPDIPLVASFDHHANVTQRIIEVVDGMVAYQQQPHLDTFETGERAGALLFALVENRIQPTIGWHKIPFIAPSYKFLTGQSPMKELFGAARELEKRPDVLAVSVFPVHAQMDVAELGWSTAVVTDGDQNEAQRLAAELAQRAWDMRHELFPEMVPPDEAVRRALAAKDGPIVLVDGADNINGGAPGDSTWALKALLKAPLDRPAFLPIVDPEAVEQAIAAGIGNEVTLEVGGKRDYIYSEPVPVTGRVTRISDGRFEISGHIGGAMNMGRTVLLEIGEIKLVLSQRIGPGHDPAVYSHLGLDPTAAQMVVVKCTAGFWAGYGLIMKDHIILDCPGLTANDLTILEWHKAPRPMYPLDDLREWRPTLSAL